MRAASGASGARVVRARWSPWTISIGTTTMYNPPSTHSKAWTPIISDSHLWVRRIHRGSREAAMSGEGAGRQGFAHVVAQAARGLGGLVGRALQHDAAVAGFLVALGLAVPQVQHLGGQGPILAQH